MISTKEKGLEDQMYNEIVVLLGVIVVFGFISLAWIVVALIVSFRKVKNANKIHEGINKIIGGIL